MLSVAEARDRILAGLGPTQTEVVALPDARGRVAAAPLVSRRTQPPADLSAMDGYALRAADGQEGARLRVVGIAPAGHPYAGMVGPGEAVRLYTGSVLPEGADAVLLQEDAERAGETVVVREAARPGRHVRRRGQDFAEGDAVIPAGRRLGARDIGLAAAANLPWITVHRRPRVAILATGDEIVMPGEPIGPGGIVSSNSHAVAALVRAHGGEPVLLPIVRDDTAAIAASIDALSGVDLLVTMGGASVGDYDLVQAGLAARGFELDFWQIAMRPGKPLMHGHLRALPVLGLPGNPVSSVVCSVLFLLPALAALSGETAAPAATTTAVLGAPVRANDHRADHLRARLERSADGRLVATPFAMQDSAALRLLAEAHCLVLRAPHAPALPPGAPVEVIRLDTLGI